MNLKISRRQFIWKSSLLSAGILTTSKGIGAQTGPSVRFGLASDSHYADRDPRGTRYYRQSLDKMREFVAVINQEKVDFAIHLGDFKDEDANQRTADTLSYLRSIEEVFGHFDGPRYHCVGNHDVDSITKQQFLANIDNTGIPKDKSYYSFDFNGVHFVVLDANYHKDGRDHFFREGANWQNTNITVEQMEWLRQDLAATSHPTIVFCHHPLYKYVRGINKFHVNQSAAVQEIMVSSGKVMAVFQGHVHDEKFKEIDGIHYVTQWGMVDHEGLENNSFAIVEIDNNAINIIGYKRVASKRLG